MNDEEALRKALARHDWYHEYADSGYNRRLGEQSWQRIVALCKRIDPETVVKVWLETVPREFDHLLKQVA